MCQIIADALALLSGDLVSLVMGPEITAAKLTWMKWLAYARLVITASRRGRNVGQPDSPSRHFLRIRASSVSPIPAAVHAANTSRACPSVE